MGGIIERGLVRGRGWCRLALGMNIVHLTGTIVVFGLVAWLRRRFGAARKEKLKKQKVEDEERKEVREMWREYAAGYELAGQGKDEEMVAK